MVKVTMVVHPRGLGPKEAGKAWYSLFPQAPTGVFVFVGVGVGGGACFYDVMQST